MTSQPTIEELLDRAVRAINLGDRATADALAGQVLAVDRANPDAEELLASPIDGGEIRRLTMLFADLVDSTALSTRIDVETYRTVVGRYRDEVARAVTKYEGHIGSTKGDGLLAVFGHPKAHENDAQRAVQAGLDITREVASLSERVRRRFGFDIDVRVGIHRGLVYLDTAQDDVYGLGANLAARMCSLAEPGEVIISDAIARVVGADFELEGRPAKAVKGVDGLMVHHRVLGERDLTSVARGPLVGRERELGYLADSWRHATAGTLRTPGVALVGEGGIGKSRLAAAVVEMAERSGAVVLDLHGSPFHTNVGLCPVRRLLERRSGIKANPDPALNLRKLQAEIEKRSIDPVSAVPLLAPVLGIGPEAGYRPATANAGRLYDQIAGAVKDYLLACLGDGPGLLLVEDIHWIDEDTMEIVEALLREDSGRLLIVITGRLAPPFSAATQVFELKPLGEAEADTLICALHPDLKPDERRVVEARCDGIPLFIEEVVAKLRDRSSDPGNATEVPDTLYEALIARLRSSGHTLMVVETAALIGSRIDNRLLASVLAVDQDEVDELLAELTRGRALEQIGRHSWRFHHELLREVAAELSPPSVRRRLHSRIADALAATGAAGAPEWPLVAHHYQQADRFDEAASAFQRASSNARQRGALGEARNHLTRALENTERVSTARVRDRREIAIRLERGFLASAAAGHASTEAAAEFERCLELIGDEPSPELFATFSALWSYYATRGDLRRATELAEVLRTRHQSMPDWYRVANDAVFGSLAAFRGEFDTARATLEAAAAEVETIDSAEIEGTWYAPNDPIGGMYTLLAFTRFMQGDLAGAERAFLQMERRCELLPFPHGPFTICYGRVIEGLVRAEAGQYRLGIARVEDLASRAHQYGFDEWVFIAASAEANTRATSSLLAGEFDAATLTGHIQTLTAVVEAWRAAETKSFLAWYDAALARVLLAAGQTSAARDRVDLALQMSDETGWRIYDAELLRLRAHTFTDPDARHQALCTAIEFAQKQGTAVLELRAAADDFMLGGESSELRLEDALSRFPADQSWPELARARALLE